MRVRRRIVAGQSSIFLCPTVRGNFAAVCWISSGMKSRVFLRRALQGSGVGLLGYVLFFVLGCVPQNLGYQRPAAGAAVRIFVRSNEIHTDLVLPVTCDDPAIDWRERFPPTHFQSDVRDYRYVAVGWGNRQFYVETPR